VHKVLVLGASGYLGKAIVKEMGKNKELQVYGTYLSHPALESDKMVKVDLGDASKIEEIVETLQPKSIVSCLRGDFEKQLLFHEIIAKYVKNSGGRIYFFSTANVFDNDLKKPHCEEERPNSCTDYGQYKIACENSLLAIGKEQVCILRLPQVWGKESPRMTALLNSLHQNEEITVYPNLFFNTNTDIKIARQLCHIMKHDLKGIFHLAAGDVMSHEAFYNNLMRALNFKGVSVKSNFSEEGYFALLSKREDEFPEGLRVTNQSVNEEMVHG